eukprot:11209386-Lingulodinium_polyedra.AAC.1
MHPINEQTTYELFDLLEQTTYEYMCSFVHELKQANARTHGRKSLYGQQRARWGASTDSTDNQRKRIKNAARRPYLSE